MLKYEFSTNNCAMSQSDCKIDVAVTNPTNDTLSPRYVNTGGGPAASVTYHVTIYDDEGNYCHSGLFDGAVPAHETVQAKVGCMAETMKGDMGTPTRVVVYDKEYNLGGD